MDDSDYTRRFNEAVAYFNKLIDVNFAALIHAATPLIHLTALAIILLLFASKESQRKKRAVELSRLLLAISAILAVIVSATGIVLERFATMSTLCISIQLAIYLGECLFLERCTRKREFGTASLLALLFEIVNAVVMFTMFGLILKSSTELSEIFKDETLNVFDIPIEVHNKMVGGGGDLAKVVGASLMLFACRSGHLRHTIAFLVYFLAVPTSSPLYVY